MQFICTTAMPSKASLCIQPLRQSSKQRKTKIESWQAMRSKAKSTWPAGCGLCLFQVKTYVLLSPVAYGALQALQLPCPWFKNYLRVISNGTKRIAVKVCYPLP